MEMARTCAEVETLIHSVEQNHRLRCAQPRELLQDKPPDRPGRQVCFADPLVTRDRPPTSSVETGGPRSAVTSCLIGTAHKYSSGGAKGGRMSTHTRKNSLRFARANSLVVGPQKRRLDSNPEALSEPREFCQDPPRGSP